MSSPAPSLAALLERTTLGILRGVHTAIPATVLAYDKARQCVDVQPLIDGSHPAEDDARVSKPLPVQLDVPVAFMGAGEYSETFPIAQGATVLLVVCSASLKRWKVTGKQGDPADDRRNHLADAIAFAGVRAFAHALSNVPDNAWVISVPTGAEIRLGSPAAALTAAHVPGVEAAITAALANPAIVSAQGALLTAIATGIPATIEAAQEALNATISAHFTATPTQGATKVKVE